MQKIIVDKNLPVLKQIGSYVCSFHPGEYLFGAQTKLIIKVIELGDVTADFYFGDKIHYHLHYASLHERLFREEKRNVRDIESTRKYLLDILEIKNTMRHGKIKVPRINKKSKKCKKLVH